MADAFEKFKNSINRGVTVVSMKTSTSLEKARIKSQIDKLNDEIQRMMTAVGEAVYLMWSKGDTNFSKLNDHLQVITQKKEEIVALNTESAALDQRNCKILDNAADENGVSGADIVGNVCPGCNTTYAEGAKFCRKCGYKLLAE